MAAAALPIREAEDGAAVALDQVAKGAFVALPGTGDRVGIGIACLHPVHWTPPGTLG